MKLLSTLLIEEEHKALSHTLLNYLVALLLPLPPLLLGVLLLPEMSKQPMLLALFFFPMIALSAWNGGFIPGIITAVASAFAIGYVLLPPYFSFTTFLSLQIIQLLLFLVEGIGINILTLHSKHRYTVRDYIHREKTFRKQIAELEEEHRAAKKEIRSRDEFLSIASHELKTPLTSMLLQTQTALHNMKNVSLARFSIGDLLGMLESVENQTKRLSKMINDLLNVSLITTGNLSLDPEDVDIATLVKEVVADFSTRLEREGVSLTYSEQETVIGHWDKLRIEQAVSNLISNAIKYGIKKPITLSTKNRNGYMRISIKDQGIGISKENQKKIFGLFERGVASDAYKGLGVGLYITNQIVKKHGGMLMVASTLGKGSTFIIDLPVKPRKKPDGDTAA